MAKQWDLLRHTLEIGSVLLLSLRPPDTRTSSFFVKRTASKVSSRASRIRNDLASMLMIVELSLRMSRTAENGANGPLVKNRIVTGYRQNIFRVSWQARSHTLGDIGEDEHEGHHGYRQGQCREKSRGKWLPAPTCISIGNDAFSWNLP